jgi:purine-nucleoside/S-methyl-5'-thioadenosine phosphorylase / adenosine deaminase
VFARRDNTSAEAGRVDLAFTDRHGGVSTEPYDSLDLSRSRPGHDEELQANLALLATGFGVSGFATMRQVHGADVVEVSAAGPVSRPCDALITTEVDVALCVRVGDCAPVVLADAGRGVVGVAHAGRPGVVAGVVPATVDAMRDRGAVRIEAWIGPYVCSGCYEVPASMRDEVAEVVPAAYACTTWGTPSVDIGAAVHQQLLVAGCTVYDRSRCTMESTDLYSHRRDQERSGRFAGIVVRRGPDHE